MRLKSLNQVNNTGLSGKCVAQINYVFATHDKVEQVLLYGSRALGTYKAGSDIDLTLLGNELSTRDLLSILVELDDLLLPYKFDVSIYSQLTHKELINHIEKAGKPFYQKNQLNYKANNHTA